MSRNKYENTSLRNSVLPLQNIRVHLPLVAKLYQVDESRRILKIAAIFEGLGITENPSDDKGGIIYKGPDVYEEFCRNQHLKYGKSLGLKKCSVKLDTVEIKEEYLYDIDVPQFEVKVVEESTELTEQEKEIAKINLEKRCTCGHTKYIKGGIPVNNREGQKVSSKSKVLVGGSRRTRCKKCTGCLTPPCKRCNFCLLPHLKKPCALRVCLYPKAPNCPCFA